MADQIVLPAKLVGLALEFDRRIDSTGKSIDAERKMVYCHSATASVEAGLTVVDLAKVPCVPGSLATSTTA